MASALILISSLLIIPSTSKTLPCDGVEYYFSGYGIMEPAGVCKQDSEGGSSMYICQSSDSIFQAFYPTEDCSGNPSFATKFNSLDIYDNVTITCCSGNQCDYGLITTYNTTNCDDDISTDTSVLSSSDYVIGYCNDIGTAIEYTSCSNGVLEYDYWVSSKCTGDATDTLTTSTGDCDSDGAQEVVTCGTAIDTCESITTSTSPPDFDCDRLEYTVYGVTSVFPAGVCSSFDDEGSRMYICESSDTMTHTIYNSDDCTGTPYYNEPISTVTDLIPDLESSTIYCCTGNACGYASQISTYTSKCADESSGNGPDDDSDGSNSIPLVLGNCEGVANVSYFRFGCSDGKLIQSSYWDDECSDEPYSVRISYDGGCDTGLEMGITCNTAIYTCDVDTTSPTTSPTEVSDPGAAASKFMLINYILYALVGICVFFI